MCASKCLADAGPSIGFRSSMKVGTSPKYRYRQDTWSASDRYERLVSVAAEVCDLRERSVCCKLLYTELENNFIQLVPFLTPDAF